MGCERQVATKQRGIDVHVAARDRATFLESNRRCRWPLERRAHGRDDQGGNVGVVSQFVGEVVGIHSAIGQRLHHHGLQPEQVAKICTE